MLVTTYFQTVATVIPVLFVAGLMNPSLLREYSKNAERSRKLNRDITQACSAMVLAIAVLGVAYAVDNVEELDDWVRISLQVGLIIVAAYCGFVTGLLVFYVQKIVRLATEEYPHPDRLESEAKDLEHRLSLVRRQLRKPTADESSDR